VFERFQASIDPEWVAQALVTTGTAMLRRRRLPAEAIKFQLVLFAAISPGKMPKVLDRFHRELAASCVLPPRRSERLCPRAVKIKMSNYPRKRPSVK